MDEDHGGNGWGEWRRHVLIEMEQHRKALEKIHADFSDVKTEIALLKLKSSLWGAVGAGLVVILTALIYALISYGTKR